MRVDGSLGAIYQLQQSVRSSVDLEHSQTTYVRPYMVVSRTAEKDKAANTGIKFPGFFFEGCNKLLHNAIVISPGSFLKNDLSNDDTTLTSPQRGSSYREARVIKRHSKAFNLLGELEGPVKGHMRGLKGCVIQLRN